MKKFCFNFCTACLLAIVFFSCEEEALDSGINPIESIQQEDPFSVIIDDSKYLTSNIEAYVIAGKISLSAQSSDLGTFLLSIDGVERREYKDDELTMQYVSPTGESYSNATAESGNAELTITKIDYLNNRIFGTFSFIGTKAGSSTQETKTFSNGKFNNITISGNLLVEP